LQGGDSPLQRDRGGELHHHKEAGNKPLVTLYRGGDLPLPLVAGMDLHSTPIEVGGGGATPTAPFIVVDLHPHKGVGVEIPLDHHNGVETCPPLWGGFAASTRGAGCKEWWWGA